jgi:8-oxo-dGTP diphosphatase
MADYPKPNLTADAVVLRPQGETYELLLIQRKRPPFVDHWALPGGFVDAGETTRQAAIRELLEETRVRAEPILEIGVADRPGRDPRGWTVSSVWLFMVPAGTEASAGDDAACASWHDWAAVPPELAFDHAEVLDKTRNRVRERLATPDGWKSLLSEDLQPTPEAQRRVAQAFS